MQGLSVVEAGHENSHIDGKGDNSLYSKDDKQVLQTTVDPVQKTEYETMQIKFKAYTADLKTIISQKLEENQQKLVKDIKKYMNDIEKFKIDKENHANKLAQIRKEFEDKYSLASIREVNQRLLKEEDELKGGISQVETDIHTTKDVIEKKKDLAVKHLHLVKAQSKDNVRLAALAEKLRYELEKVQKEIDRTRAKEAQAKKPHLPSVFKNKGLADTMPILNDNQGQTSESRMLRSSALAMIPRLSKYQRNSQDLYHKINRVFLKDLDIFNLFRDCLGSYFNYVKKTQQITQHNGLQDSLLFEIIQKSAKCKVSYPHLRDKTRVSQVQAQLQDRHMVNIVYESMKSEIHDKKTKQYQKARKFNITWNDLKEFNSLQVMGLLVMHWDVLTDVLLEWENFLNRKSKLIKTKRHLAIRH